MIPGAGSILYTQDPPPLDQIRGLGETVGQLLVFSSHVTGCGAPFLRAEHTRGAELAVQRCGDAAHSPLAGQKAYMQKGQDRRRATQKLDRHERAVWHAPWNRRVSKEGLPS